MNLVSSTNPDKSILLPCATSSPHHHRPSPFTLLSERPYLEAIFFRHQIRGRQLTELLSLPPSAIAKRHSEATAHPLDTPKTPQPWTFLTSCELLDIATRFQTSPKANLCSLQPYGQPRCWRRYGPRWHLTVLPNRPVSFLPCLPSSFAPPC